MSNQQNFRKQRKKTALDHAKMRLYGEKLDNAKSAPTLLFYLTEDGNPRIDVYTGVEGDKDNGLIRAAMDIRTAQALIALSDEVIKHDGPCRFYISNKNYLWPGGKRSDSPVEVSKTVIGKAEDGRIYLSLVAKERPKAIFYMTSPFFHKVTDAEGQPIEKGLESRLFAKGYFGQVRELLAIVSAITYKEPQPKGQGGGGYNRGGGNGGGYNNNNGGGNYGNNGGGNGNGGNSGGGNDYDDDMPF
tara:strand:+ start:96745 stop:97479 length:735 start_codon:yes stop_codon:yes gene_type:complete